MGFQGQSESLEQIKSEIISKINELDKISIEKEWDETVSVIQDKFSEFQMAFADFNNSIPDMDMQEKDDARKLYTKMNNEIQSLEESFNEKKKTGFVQKTKKLSEQMKDIEADQTVPDELKNIDPEVEDRELPSISLVEDSNPTLITPLPMDVNTPLNPLEADIETRDTDAKTKTCTKHRRIFLSLATIFCILGVVCFLIFYFE